MTITKSFLAVLNSLSESFSPSALEKISRKEVPMEPFLVENLTGSAVTLMLGDNRSFTVQQSGGKAGRGREGRLGQTKEEVVDLQPGTSHPLNLKFNRLSSDQTYRTYVSPLRSQSDQSEATLKLKLGGARLPVEIPINKADTRFFCLPFRGSEQGDEPGIVSRVRVENGTKFVTLTSVLSFKNHYPDSIKVWHETQQQGFTALACLAKGEVWHCPADKVYSQTGQFFFSLSGPAHPPNTAEPVCWRDIAVRGRQYRRTVKCSNTDGQPDVYLNIEGVANEVFNARSSDLSRLVYSISIRPSVVLKNCLPMPLSFACGGSTEFKDLQEGGIGCLEDMKHGQTLLRLKLFGWRGVDLQCNKVFEENMKPLEYWRFESADPASSSVRIDLGVMKEVSRGTTVLSIFAPFWFVNKTQKRLHFKGHDGASEMVHYPEDEKIPLMFSYISKSLLGKKKISLKVDNSLWSDPFTIDTIGDTGKISCKLDSRRGSLKRNFQRSDKKCEDAFHVGIQISQSSSSFTKIVTFTPYYMIYNAAPFPLVVKEVEEECEEVEVPVEQCVPFWPVYGGGTVVCRAADQPGVTVPFSLHHQVRLSLYCRLIKSNSVNSNPVTYRR